MRRWIIPLLLMVLLAAFWWLRPRPRSLGEAYVGERSVTLWSSLAQVKQPVGRLRYGEKVAVLDRKGEQAEVRTAQGARGWLDARALMEPALWQRSADLLAQARAMPVQARGHTKVASNVRVEPGRAATRLFQFGRGTPVEVLSRASIPWSVSTEESQSAAKESPEEEPKPRREDWVLVRGFAASAAGPAGGESAPGKEEGAVEVAGWVVARFVELDLPGPVRDYVSSAGLRAVAVFELNRVADETGGKPQYLVAAIRSGEGRPCDFSMIRVYTWGAQRRHYETAYVESNLCGRLPIRVAQSAAGPEFRFAALAPSKTRGKVEPASAPGYEERLYRMRQTIVRRVRFAESAAQHAAGKPEHRSR